MALARRGVDQYDVVVGEVPSEGLGGEIARHLTVKGFCTLSPGFYDGRLDAALLDAGKLDFYRAHPAIAEGLLGLEGSGQIADLDSSADEDRRGEGEAIRGVDDAMTKIWYKIGPYAEHLGFEMRYRSDGVVHRCREAAAEDEEEEPSLTERAVSKWHAQFDKHKVMILVFLGPTSGVLELVPHGAEDVEAEPVEVKTSPGSLVVLRADQLLHKYTASGEATAVSCFLCSRGDGGTGRRPPAEGARRTPAAVALEEWTRSRLMELKSQEDTTIPWDEEIPRSWQSAMNHSFHKGQLSGISGIACHFPLTYDPDVFFRACIAGPDYVTEVPQMRWDHDTHYDPDEFSWTQTKTNCRHATFMEGIDMFDNKFFSLSMFESKALDPHARVLLEVAYSALHNHGFIKKHLMNSNGGVYVGCTNNEAAYMAPKEHNFVSGGVSGFLCMFSGRISFCLGMKGPAISMSTEAASGLTAAHLAGESVQKKGTAVGCDFAVALGVHILLSPVWWSNESMLNRNCPEGRCLTFNASASGYVRADGCGAATFKNCTELVDGQLVKNEKDQFYGTVAGSLMTNSGHSASLASPNSVSEQQIVADCVRNACIGHLDVDTVEVHGSGQFLADAIEVNAVWRAHRGSGSDQERLAITATKSSVGSQVECGGITSLLKTVLAAQWGHHVPNLHLRQINPHIDTSENPIDIPAEGLMQPFRNTFAGVKARGLGGANVYTVLWGELTADRTPPAPPDLDRQPMLFWPGGGGELELEALPRRKDGYYVVGTWSRWEEPVLMQPTGEGRYGFTLALGENGWEKFQIWLDGNPARALHPGEPKAGQGSSVYGPDDCSGENSAAKSQETPAWVIDGRSWDSWDDEENENPDLGKPGDQYRVELQINGKWRMVTWRRLRALTSGGEESLARGASRTRHFLAASWNNWNLEEMRPDSDVPGRFELEVRFPGHRGEFQIVRDGDWDQVFYPATHLDTGDSPSEVLGPDDQGEHCCWLLQGVAQDTFRIEFQRSLEGGQDVRRIAWQRV